MTVSIGQHVHPVGEPGTDLVVDAVAPQGAGSAWLHAHDPAGHDRYVAAEDVVSEPRHALGDPAQLPFWAPNLITKIARNQRPQVALRALPVRHAAPEQADTQGGAS